MIRLGAVLIALCAVLGAYEFIERGRTRDVLQAPLNDTYDFIIGKTCSPHMTFKTVQNTRERLVYL